MGLSKRTGGFPSRIIAESWSENPFPRPSLSEQAQTKQPDRKGPHASQANDLQVMKNHVYFG